MTLNELIDKLTEMKRYVSGYADVDILANEDWFEISDIQINRGNEEEMVSDSVIIFAKEEL